MKRWTRTVSTRDSWLCCRWSQCTRHREDSSCTNGIWYGILKLSLAVKQQIFNFETVHLTLLLPPPPAVESGGYSSGNSGRLLHRWLVGGCGPWVEVVHGWEWRSRVVHGWEGLSGVVHGWEGLSGVAHGWEGRYGMAWGWEGLAEWLGGGRNIEEWFAGGRGP